MISVCATFPVRESAMLGMLGETLEVVSLVAGLLLLLLAFGGGTVIEQISIPRASRPMRILAGIVGALLIVAGFALNSRVQSLFRPTPETIDIVVSANLGQLQDAQEIATDLRVYIDGNTAAEFSLNSESRSMSKDVTLARADKHSYSIRGHSVWSTDPNRPVEVVGSGELVLQDGATYVVSSDLIYEPPSPTEKWKLRLRQD
jgi:hypothetical protein